jgi:hypothetical protein
MQTLSQNLIFLKRVDSTPEPYPVDRILEHANDWFFEYIQRDEKFSSRK